MFGIRRNQQELDEMTSDEKMYEHMEKAEKLLHLGGVGNKQMVRVATQANAHATMALLYQMQSETSSGEVN